MQTWAVLEDQTREVKLGCGLRIMSFYDPPVSAAEGAAEPVRRWRVRLPDWFDSGSWLDGDHAFESLEAALAALNDSGTLDAIDAYWRAKSALSAARQSAFSKIMAAHTRTDRDYTAKLAARRRA